MPRRCAVALATLVGLTALSAPSGANAQAAAGLRVLSDQGGPVPFAVVRVGKSALRIADDSGRVSIALPAGDSIRVNARRIGYREFDGWLARPKGSVELTITLTPLAQQIGARVIEAPSPLTRAGFYDRVRRVQRGAFVGEFITPEEIELWPGTHTSQLMMGRQHVRVRQVQNISQAKVLVGRGGCGMTIIIDGQRINNTVESVVDTDVPRNINPGIRRNQSGLSRDNADEMPSIDELLGGREVVAVEIYPSTANAPAELIPLTGSGSCGIVVFHTKR